MKRSFGEQFLVYPDLFPVRRSGERWGSEVLEVDFAGGPYRFTGLSREQISDLKERYRDLCVDLGKPEGSDRIVTVDVFRVPESDFRKFELAGWHHEIDFLHDERTVLVAGLLMMGRVELGGVTGGALWTPAESGPDLLGVFENFFRVIVAYRLLSLGGVLLHSAGVVLDRSAHLFLGHSGAGKTTLSRLALEAGLEVLSDDVNAIVPDAEGKPVVEKLPFAGELGDRGGRSDQFRLGSLCRLEQAKTHGVFALSPARALAQLLTCSPFVNSDPFRQDPLVEACEGLLSQVKPKRVTFKKDVGIWDVLRRGAE